jgi:hypothetical protein
MSRPTDEERVRALERSWKMLGGHRQSCDPPCNCDLCWEVRRETEAILRAIREPLERELERHRHGVTLEGDFICPDSLALTEAQAEIARLKGAVEQLKENESYAFSRGLAVSKPDLQARLTAAEQRATDAERERDEARRFASLDGDIGVTEKDRLRSELAAERATTARLTEERDAAQKRFESYAELKEDAVQETYELRAQLATAHAEVARLTEELNAALEAERLVVRSLKAENTARLKTKAERDEAQAVAAALRTVLLEAVEALSPQPYRHLMGTEWLDEAWQALNDSTACVAAHDAAVRQAAREEIADAYEEIFCRSGLANDEKHARGDCEACNIASAIRTGTLTAGDPGRLP